MVSSPYEAGSSPVAQGSPQPAFQIKSLIERCSRLLPGQGPISIFVAQNTLSQFENFPFHEGLQRASEAFHCEVYLAESRYRQYFSMGRISKDDLAEVLRKDLGPHQSDELGSLGTRYDLRSAMLSFPLIVAPDRHLEWLLAETHILQEFRPEAPPETTSTILKEAIEWVEQLARNDAAQLEALQLQDASDGIASWPVDWQIKSTLRLMWQICQQGTRDIPVKARPRRSLRVRGAIFELTTCDPDVLVNDLLIRFCSAYLDQGLATLQLPHREEGFWASFCELYRSSPFPVEMWRSPLSRTIRDYQQRGMGPLEVIVDSLHDLGISEENWEAYITETLLALPGWGGMIWQMETNAEWTARPAPKGSLVEFVAVRLMLDRLAIRHVANKELGYRGPLKDLDTLLKPRCRKEYFKTALQRAFVVFQLAQIRGWGPRLLAELTPQGWTQLIDEIEAFPSAERRRIFHEAFERHFREQALSAVAARIRRPLVDVQNPRFRVITCIDDREESFRRYLEELCPDCETSGAAGFFATPIYYRGASDAHFAPLCPIVMKPSHYVSEEVAYGLEQTHRRRAHARHLLGRMSHLAHRSSRSFLTGILMSLVGPLASIPLVARVLFPRLTARWVSAVGTLVQTPPVTRLRLERFASPPGPSGNHLGFTLDEMTGIVARQLQDIGLTRNYSRLVLFLGHGSSSVNNPHESAYHCGACGGGRGGPNARSICQMANDPRVRARLVDHGISLPDETIFIGGMHNTCDDSVVWYDLEEVPASHREEFERVRLEIDHACALNAQERIRRFAMAPRGCSPEKAWDHVEERSVDLSQTRPEYTHASVAMCIVGRRERIRGLFLDRRSFLVSYDPGLDDADCRILQRVIEAAIPVCAGIGLNYFFSTVDNAKLGCGSKLPHNITSLLGVMDGAASDLRTGLSAQMVEIHEPMRILFVLETTPETMTKLMARSATISRLVRNEWVQLATLDPNTETMHFYQNGGFFPVEKTDDLRQFQSSTECYSGADNMSFSLVVPRELPADSRGMR